MQTSLKLLQQHLPSSSSMSEMTLSQLGLLLVDDEEYSIKALKRILRGQGFNIFSANSAKQALEVLEQETIAIVVSDMQMPEVTGDKLLIEIEERWPEVVKIVLSGYSDYSGTLNLLHCSSIYRYISKPWDDKFLIETLHGAAAVFWGKVANKLIQQSTKKRIELLNDKNKALTDTVQDGQVYLSGINEKLAQAQKEEKFLQQKMEQAKRENDAKSRFLATMSHEIRTPLNSVIATNSLLLESELNDEQIELVKLSLSGATTLLSLINDILDSSKINAGKLELNKSWFNPIHLIENVAELLAGQCVDRSLEVICLVSVGTPNLVFGDPTRVEQIVTNLVSNGIKFTDHGCVKIRLSFDGELRICVEDTGVGCPEDQLETIFHEFTQVDSSSTREMGGTGLGLSICRQFAHLMGGQIKATSTVGVGSQFVVRLPLAAKQFIALPEVVRGTSAKALVNETLILTSNRKFGEAIVELLEEFKIRAEVSSTLAALGTDQYDNIIYDVETLGLPCVEQLNKNAFCMALIGTGGVGRTLKLKDNGFDAVLRKPLRLSSLVRQFICSPNRRSNIQGDSTHNPADNDSSVAEYKIDHFSEEQKTIFRNWFVNTALHNSNTGVRNLSNAHILLAEDSPSNQAVIKSILRNMNARVTVANNGQEAIARAHEQQFDIILMDMAMPIIDGLSATRAIIGESKRNADTPIIALTANAFYEDQQCCRESGMVDFISKPVDIYEFREKMYYWNSIGDAEEPGTQPPVVLKETEGAGVFENRPSEVIDFQIIKQLEIDTSREALPGIIAIYIEETRARIPLMLDSSAAKDWTMLSSEAHKLKSSSGSFGAVALQKLALNIESNIESSDWSALMKNMKNLEPLATQSLGELDDATTYC